eukprot:TRINITY_DN28221_c0_g1_i1.p1 TRINITY_DN28221_c0_g1~~TRINITY_DN28221_c0_g1_i1.p1  ORF type:complete len:117 (-),score=16.54 TRINITY_DN28221_c0_g1_i1:56-406(-)
MSEIRMHVSFSQIKDQEKFLKSVQVLINTIKKSPGCISTGLFKELGGNSFAIIETWESEAACDKDTNSDHVAGFLKEMGGLGYCGGQEIFRFLTLMLFCVSYMYFMLELYELQSLL